MKLRNILAVILCAVMAVGMIVLTTSAQEQNAKYEVGEGFISFDFSDVTGGIVNSKKNANVEKNVSFEGMNAVRFTPTPDTYDGNTLNLDCYFLGKYADKGVQITVPDYKYMGVTYYYAPKSEPVYTGNLKMTLLPGSTSAIKSSLGAESHEPLVAGKWTEAYFDFSSMTLNPDHKEGQPYIVQCHFNPFGSTALESITADDVFYVAKYTFYKTNPDKNAKVKISYNKATPEAQGQEYTDNIPYGETYKLPECPFTYDSSVFKGWISSQDNKVYAPGTEMKAEVNTTYTASWEVIRNVEDFVSLKYVDYSNEIVNGADTAYLENTTKDGRDVVMCTPNPNRTSTSKTISLDGYKYAGANIDLNAYRWFAVEYFYQAPNPKELNMRIDIMTSNTVLLKSVGAYSVEPLVANTWATALFDMSVLEGNVNPDNPTPNMKQMHLRAYGMNNIDILDASDVMYISRVMFFKEKPDFVAHTAYMNGYADGTFKPAGTMTRAEACTVVARLLEKEENIAGTSNFADVKGHWAEKYIGLCEAKGLLASYSGNFAPDQAITRAEFSELVYLTGLAKDKGLTPVFADVAADHPKYASIMAAAKAGLINGYDEGNGTFTFKPDNTVTRAEVVTIINRARDLSKKAADLTSDIAVLFLDVDDTHWAHADIAEATVPHIEWNGAWLYPQADPAKMLEDKVGAEKLYDLAAGKAKIAELDALEAKRIEEIRNTPNKDLTGFTGRKIYVSNAGDDKNDGLSEATPVKSAAKGSALAKSGDIVLFKRGDTWYEKFNAKSGVTYSAYDEGAKPLFNGSFENGADPEKWTLVHEDAATGARIWKFYREDWKDIGTIVFNNGEGSAYKDMPDNLKGSKNYTVYKTKTPYDWKVELDRNFEFVHLADSSFDGSYISLRDSTGPIYLRCDNGNPGKIFDSIEFVTYGAVITCGGNPNVTIDNLEFRNSSFGISSGTNKNLTVTNCEFRWIGGNIQTYEMRNGIATRYGNAIEVYGGIDGYLVDNCYFYEIYDAAVTHQVGAGAQDLVMDNITYSNNVMDKCQYSIEYFFSAGDTPTVSRKGKNVVFENNLMRRAGYGFGSTRRDLSSQRHIRSGSSRNEFTDYVIRNNVFDRSVYELAETQCNFAVNAPVYENNIYIQGVGNQIYTHSTGASAKMDISAAANIRKALGDENAQVYFAEYIPPYEWGFTYAKTAPVNEDDKTGLEAVKPGSGSGEVSADGVPTEAGESDEVVAPLVLKTTKNKLYAELRKAITMETKTDEAAGITYGHGTIVNEDASVNLDCYSLPKFSLESGVIYIKALIRTNCAGKAIGYVYSMVDADGAKVGNGVTASYGTTVKGDGEWEEIYIKFNDFPMGATHSTQIHFLPLGSVKGTKFHTAAGFETNDKKAPYLDVAAWAIFPNYASAEAYDLKAAAKAE